ncbi:MAG: hypothetical protein WAT58_07290 [Candidatus Dormiibacterota bacterium]
MRATLQQMLGRRQRGALRLILGIAGAILLVVIVVAAYGVAGAVAANSQKVKADDALNAVKGDQSKIDLAFKGNAFAVGGDTPESLLGKIASGQAALKTCKDLSDKDAKIVRDARSGISQGILTLPENSAIAKNQARLDAGAQALDVAVKACDEGGKDMDMIAAVVTAAKDLDTANTAVAANDYSTGLTNLDTAKQDISRAKELSAGVPGPPTLSSFLDTYSKFIDDFRAFTAAAKDRNIGEVLRLDPIITSDTNAIKNASTSGFSSWYDDHFNEYGKKYDDLVKQSNG